MSRRTERIASSIQRQLQALLARGLQDPRVRGLITVTNVKVTDDMATAIVSISVLPAERTSATMHGLRAAAGFLRRELGELINTKRLPQLRFELDESVKREAAVLEALERVRAERESSEEPDPPKEEGTL